MPRYRDISIELRSQYDGSAYPEYAPPKTPQLTPTGHLTPVLEDPSSSTASVYIRSLPQAQFWIWYKIHRPEYSYYFFKLFMGTEHVASWGVGQEERYKGKTVFALFSNWTEDGELQALGIAIANDESDSCDDPFATAKSSLPSPQSNSQQDCNSETSLLASTCENQENSSESSLLPLTHETERTKNSSLASAFGSEREDESENSKASIELYGAGSENMEPRNVSQSDGYDLAQKDGSNDVSEISSLLGQDNGSQGDQEDYASLEREDSINEEPVEELRLREGEPELLLPVPRLSFPPSLRLFPTQQIYGASPRKIERSTNIPGFSAHRAEVLRRRGFGARESPLEPDTEGLDAATREAIWPLGEYDWLNRSPTPAMEFRRYGSPPPTVARKKGSGWSFKGLVNSLRRERKRKDDEREESLEKPPEKPTWTETPDSAEIGVAF